MVQVYATVFGELSASVFVLDKLRFTHVLRERHLMEMEFSIFHFPLLCKTNTPEGLSKELSRRDISHGGTVSFC